MQPINKVAVLGAGVMGTTIAAHLANAGHSVLLLDIVPPELTSAEAAAGLTRADPAVRNRLASAGRDGLKKMTPSPFYLPEYAALIEVGNFDDDLPRLQECDWVLEVVIEEMAIKKELLSKKVVPHLKAGAILSTNTSGLSVNEMAECLPAAIRKNFLVTHFFNPPRYMRLLEIVPGLETDPQVTKFIADFIAKRLGKGIVTAKDTPNFIANRIGVYALCNCIRHMLALEMSVEEVDAVAGPATARPKSAAFRTADLVGIDTLLHVAKNSYDLLPHDEEREIFRLPAFIEAMVAKGLLGHKSQAGFFKKVKSAAGTAFFYYDYRSGDYLPATRPKFASVEAAKSFDDPAPRLQALLAGSDKGALFAWRNLRDTLIYTVNRLPEIADDIVNIDQAMKWGFNWELGPFAILDAVGVAAFVARAEADGVAVPVLLKSVESFYQFADGKKSYYSWPDQAYQEVPQTPTKISLALLTQKNRVVEKNSGASLIDLGDGVFCLEFHTKMNTIGHEILAMVHKATQRAEAAGVGLVIANEAPNFSAGTNLMLLAMGIAAGDFDAIDLMVKNFQQAMMAIKYAKIPVVAAPHGLALGGSCEICLHADAMNPHAETYMGMVELGVGLLPAGGGTKEMAIRAIKLAESYDLDASPFIFKNFMNIALAKVSTSAAELTGMGFLRPGDAITMDLDRRIFDAKQKVIALAVNYRPARPLVDLKAPGRSVAASLKSQLWNMRRGGFISAYDEFLAGTVAEVMTGGDLPAGTVISEEYFLELEREAFLRLCGEKQTLERIQYMLKTGKPLRN